MSGSPLRLPEAQLRAHFRALGEVFAKHVDGSATPELYADWTGDLVLVAMGGNGLERAARNRGPHSWVAPLIQIGGGLWTWLGYREQWSPEPPAGETKRFSFRSGGLTVHLGQRSSLQKPQIFRAEWAGWARWDRAEFGFQAGDAGHPHWQFDVLDSLRRDEAEERATTYLAVLKQEQDGESPPDFAPELDDQVIHDLISTAKISRMHFASAAAWWKPAPQDAHAHAPAKARDIQTWVDRTVSYVVSELARL
jgi:hypothetical protein